MIKTTNQEAEEVKKEVKKIKKRLKKYKLSEMSFYISVLGWAILVIPITILSLPSYYDGFMYNLETPIGFLFMGFNLILAFFAVLVFPFFMMASLVIGLYNLFIKRSLDIKNIIGILLAVLYIVLWLWLRAFAANFD